MRPRGIIGAGVLAALMVGVIAVMSPWAMADGTVPWTGNGSDNLPCTDGGHWVLAPSFGIDSATLFVNGQSYTMTQHGNGSWSADSVGALVDPVDAYVEYTGEGDARNHLQLSHCTDAPSPPPTTPPPTTPPPTTPPPTHSPPVHHNCRGNGSERPKCQPVTPTVTPPEGVAFTGPTNVVTYGLLALAALLIGTGLVWRGYRLNR